MPRSRGRAALIGVTIESAGMTESTSDQVIEISAPPDEVFEWIADEQKARQWADTHEFVPVPRDQLRPGYRTRDGSGENEIELSIFEPPREITLIQRSSGGSSHVRFSLQPSNAGTLVRSLERVSVKGGSRILTAIPSALGLTGRWHQDEHSKALQKLKMLAEATTVSAAGRHSDSVSPRQRMVQPDGPPSTKHGSGEPDVSPEVREIAQFGEEIEAIALYRRQTGASLKDAKRVISSLRG